MADYLPRAPTAEAATQRNSIQQELERSRVAFQELVELASAEELGRRSDGTRWTNRQLLFHMVFGYLIVRTLIPLIHTLGRLGWSRRFAATLNSLQRPFHVINYLGSVGGGQLLSPAAMTRLMDRSVQALQRKLAGENDHSLNLVMHFPPTWDPYFQPTMSVADLYQYGTQHFDHHQRQLTLQGPEHPGLGIELLVTPDCPHREAAEDLLRDALVEVGLPTHLRVLTVTDADAAARHGFAGSPTFRANGADLFPAARQPAGLNCRIYRAGSESGGLPDLLDLRRALKRAADQGRWVKMSGNVSRVGD